MDPLFEADQSIRASLRRLDTLMKGKKVNEALTFYRAPSHRSFSLLAYAVGGFLIYETFLFARFALFEGPNEPNPNQPRRMPGWQKSILYAELGAVALLGTALFFSPMKLVRRISLVKNAAAAVNSAAGPTTAAATRAAAAAPERYLLEIDVHHFSPLFGRGSTLRYPLEAVTRKQRFPGQDFGLRDVPFADVEAFSREPWTRPARTAVETERRKGLSSPMLRAVVRDIKRIWVRDQMDYITLPDQGVFKVDLQEAFVLDEGRPFVGLLENVEHVPGMWQKIRMMFSLPG